MNSSEMMIVDESPAAQIVLGRDPKTILAEAQLVSGHLARYAEKHALYKQFGQSKHLMIEGWQMVANCYRVAARVVETRYLDYGNGIHGYEATAEAIHIPTGRSVGRCDAMCLNDEENWGTRPKYEWVNKERRKVGEAPVPLQQLRSMAQTRAMAKVLSSLFRWVAKFGGFAGTPGEEMTEDAGANQGRKNGGTAAPSESEADVISEAQAKRMYAIGKNAGLSEDDYKALLTRFGYAHTKKVRRADYERICEALAKKPTPDAITNEQAHGVIEACETVGLTAAEFEAVLAKFGAKNVQDLKAKDFEAVIAMVKAGGAK